MKIGTIKKIPIIEAKTPQEALAMFLMEQSRKRRASK